MKSVLNEKLVKDKILQSEWYEKQLTLLLRKSYGVKEEIELNVEITKHINDTILEFFNLIGYYDEDSEKWMLNINAINELDETKSDILDKFAMIFGVSRHYHFEKTYVLDTNEMTLDNRELFCLIYAQIIRNNYDGSLKQVYELFNKLYEITNVALIGDKSYPFNLQYDTITDASYPYAYITMNADEIVDEEGEVKEQYRNLAELVYQNIILIKSMGVKYNVDIVSWTLLALYDYTQKEGNVEDRNRWNKGVFGE